MPGPHRRVLTFKDAVHGNVEHEQGDHLFGRSLSCRDMPVAAVIDAESGNPGWGAAPQQGRGLSVAEPIRGIYGSTILDAAGAALILNVPGLVDGLQHKATYQFSLKTAA